MKKYINQRSNKFNVLCCLDYFKTILLICKRKDFIFSNYSKLDTFKGLTQQFNIVLL